LDILVAALVTELCISYRVQTFELYGSKVEENVVAVIELWVDNEGSNGKFSFIVERTQVQSVHSAGTREVKDVVREREG